jgi:hypothetical protein
MLGVDGTDFIVTDTLDVPAVAHPVNVPLTPTVTVPVGMKVNTLFPVPDNVPA